MKMLENPDCSFKEEIVRVLGDIGDPMAGKILMDLLHDPDRGVRYQAAWALYRIGGRDVAQSLCRLLSDPDEWIVINVLEILSRLKEAEAIPALVGQFEIARDPRLKAIIISSLATFAEPQLLKVFEAGLTSFDPRIQANSVEAISMLRIPALEMKRKLKKFYGHPNNRVRANVAIALHKADAAKVREEVEAMMASNDVPTRRSAAYVLSRIELPERAALIDRLLTDPAYGVRKMALKAALALESGVSLLCILPLLADPSPWVRKEAVDCARKVPEVPDDAILQAFKEEESPAVLESMLEFINERHLDQAVEVIFDKIRAEPDEGLPRLFAALGHLNARETLDKARRHLGAATPEILREYHLAVLLQGDLRVFEDLARLLKEKTREEDQLNYLYVAGEVGLFVQQMDHYSRLLRESLAVEVAKDLEGVTVLTAPPPPRLTPDSIQEGLDLVNAGKVEEARSFFDRFLAAFPGNPEALYQQANLFFKQGDPEKALPYLLDLMGKAPGHVAGGLLLGQIHFQRKRWEELMHVYEALKDRIAAEDKRTLGTVHGALGLAYFHLKRYQKAIETLTMATQANARDLSSCYHLALCYYAIKEHARAIQLLKNLRRTLPPDSRVLRNVEELLQKLEDE
jgi:HEAT repeat protein/Tfp pilus assembly protein PilF